MLESGATFADYRIEGILGQGGMGMVYEATQLSLDRRVALKVLAPHLSSDPAFRRRFKREGHAQAALAHDHIVTVYEAGEGEHGLFLSMQLVDGCNLKELLLSQELDRCRVMSLLFPIAGALDAAHAAGLVHRDIKPQNILVDAHDHSYLADFGLTKARTEASLSDAGHFVGTFDYVSPEQICGDPASKQSDLYALAAVLFECLGGTVPFPKESEVSVLYAHVHDEPPLISDVRPELPRALDPVLARAMAKEPKERHRSAIELLEEVERALLDGVAGAPLSSSFGSTALAAPPHHPATASAPTRPVAAAHPRRTRRLRRSRVTAAAVALVIVPAAGFLTGRALNEDKPFGSAEPDRAFLDAMSKTVGTLDSARRAQRTRLASARTPAREARAAAALATSHAAAARRASGLTAAESVQPMQAAIAGALTRAASGYATMAAGARNLDRRRYNRGRGRVRAADRAIRRALERRP